MTSALIQKIIEPLKPFLDNPNYKEIIIEAPYFINVETIQGKWEYFHDENLSLDRLYRMIRILANQEGKTFNEENCLVAVTIDGRHRVQATFGHRTNNNISITIRLKRNSLITLDDFNFTEDLKEKLINLVKTKKTFLISAGTGTGKTTLLNSLIKHIPASERIITIENVREIEIDPKIYTHHCSLIYLEDDPKFIAELLNSSLRKRPDRILIGELRNENSSFFLKVCRTGHGGTISTIHSDNPEDAIETLIHNIKITGNNSQTNNELREELKRKIDAILQIKREYIKDQMVVSGYLQEINQ